MKPFPTLLSSLNSRHYTKGDLWFDAAFQASANGIIRVDKDNLDWAYYKRLTNKATFQPYFYIFNNWFSFNNAINVDFELYNSYADALAGDTGKRWTSCSYDDPGVGFPRDCAGQGRGGGWMAEDTTVWGCRLTTT